MPRAEGNDLAELFGYAPDDRSDAARQQWKSQECPFVGGVCIKHSHPQEGGATVIYGACSVVNAVGRPGRKQKEEVIICPHRLYAQKYAALRSCVYDALGTESTIYMAEEYASHKRAGTLPSKFAVMIGQRSGGEIGFSGRGMVDLSLDWVFAYVEDGELRRIIPCEVQSIDITGNYRDTWSAYSHELDHIPNSQHGLNWANVWKRIIPQLILKGAVAASSTLCHSGIYFVLPDRVYLQFEKVVGVVQEVDVPGPGILNVMTYRLGPEVPYGYMRSVEHHRTVRMRSDDFATAFNRGAQVPPGTLLDAKVAKFLATLRVQVLSGSVDVDDSESLQSALL